MNDISVLPACQARECSHIIFQSYQHAKHMNAHKYDSVTIYFSDIVHFIQMVEESTPAEVIWDFLENHEFLAGGEADWAKLGFVSNVVAQRSRND